MIYCNVELAWVSDVVQSPFNPLMLGVPTHGSTHGSEQQMVGVLCGQKMLGGLELSALHVSGLVVPIPEFHGTLA